MVEFQIEAFEGPLDLLLHLISRAKIDIKDIFIAEITEQYLEYLQTMETMDMDVSSEFLTMAATLLQIKSRSLLPAPKSDEDEEDLEAELIMRLEEYKLIKEAANYMEILESEAPQVFYKLPEEYQFQQAPLNMEGVGIQDLFQAFKDMILKHEHVMDVQKEINVVSPEVFSVRKKVYRLRVELREKKRIVFSELFAQDFSKAEVIATFLALLELVAGGTAKIQQDKLFSEIVISARETAQENIDNEVGLIDEQY